MSKKVAKISLLVIALTLSILLPILAVTAKKPEWEIAPVYIDETVPGMTWADWADEPWLKGLGTEEDPYMIENVIIDAGGNFFCMIILNSEAYFKIMDCTFSNTGPYNSPEGGRNAALILVNTQNGVIFKNEMFDCGFPGTELGGGIALVGSVNNKVQKNYCHDNELSGIYVQYSNDNIIRQNLCIGNIWGIFISEWSNSNEITKNECYDNELHGILVWSEANGNLITENECKGSLVGGITVTGSHGNILTDNHCCKNQFGIILSDWSTSNEVLNNDCSNNNENGIHLWFNANNNVITENVCNENLVTGIVVGTSSRNIIMDNNCSNNVGSGIAVVDWYWMDASDNIIYHNNLNNNFYGVFLNNAYNNDIFRNTIKENYYGINLEGGSEDNLMYHNNIVDNIVQAADFQPQWANNWYHPYMLEGNFWVDAPFGYDLYPMVEANEWEELTPIEEEISDPLLPNRLGADRLVNPNETSYIRYGVIQLFTERINGEAFPPYGVKINGEEVLDSVWIFDDEGERFGEPGLMQLFYIKIPPYYLTEELGMVPGGYYEYHVEITNYYYGELVVFEFDTGFTLM